MKDLSSIETLNVPEGVEIKLKSRIVTVTGPRGTLVKGVKHIQMDIQVVSISLISGRPELSSHQGTREATISSFETIKGCMDMGHGEQHSNINQLFVDKPTWMPCNQRSKVWFSGNYSVGIC
jgi:hypothetical protein